MPNTFPTSESDDWKGDATKVRLLADWSGGDEVWRGTLEEFKLENPDTFVEDELYLYGYILIGGGAEQAFTLEVVS